MQKLAAQQRLEEMELLRMQEDLGRGALTGHLSEPTTPPEYRETSSGFPTMFSRPNRYSTSSLVSPQTMFNQRGRSGSQLTSPQSSAMPSRFGFDDQIPSRSVPGSRRNSDDDEKEEALRQDPTSHRSTNAYVFYLFSLRIRHVCSVIACLAVVCARFDVLEPIKVISCFSELAWIRTIVFCAVDVGVNVRHIVHKAS